MWSLGSWPEKPARITRLTARSDAAQRGLELSTAWKETAIHILESHRWHDLACREFVGSFRQDRCVEGGRSYAGH